MSYSSLLKSVILDKSKEKIFRKLEFTATLYPLIIRLYMQDKLDAVLSSLEALEVRVYKTRGTNPIADAYWLSSLIAESDYSIQQIKDMLKNFAEKFMSDHVFKNYLDSDIYGNGAVKYILAEKDGGDVDYGKYSSLQIEHIFSDDPKFDVEIYGFEEDYEYEKNRFGNLMLLEEKINKSIGNLAPLNKVDGYLQSSIESTRNMAGEIQVGSFSKGNVDIRREQLIKFCLERFVV